MLLIAYASKTGNAKEAAERLAELLPQAVLVDLAQETPVLEEYDEVIIGAGVRVGAAHKTAKEFLRANKATLATKKYAIFISNCFADTVEEILVKSVDAETLKGAVWAGSVGGWLNMEKVRGVDKVLAKAATKAVKDGQKVNEELDLKAISELAACFE